MLKFVYALSSENFKTKMNDAFWDFEIANTERW